MASFTSLPLDYAAEFLRGWPVDGGLEVDYPIATGQTLSLGDLVKPVVQGGKTHIMKTVVGDIAGAAGFGAGIVVRGNGDEKSSAEINKAVVLWGHYIVRTTKFDTTPVTGILAAGVSVVAGTDGKFFLATDNTVPSLGYVLEYKAAVGSIPAEIIVVVK